MRVSEENVPKFRACLERLLLHAAGGGGHGHGVRRVVMVLLLKCSQGGTRGCFQNDCRTLGSPSTIYTIVSKGEVNALLCMLACYA